MSYARALGFCLIMSFSAIPSLADIYKTVGPNGQITYSDVPTGQKITAIDLPSINSQPAQVPNQKLSNLSSRGESNFYPTSYQPQISFPADNTEIPPGQRDLTVSTSDTSSLRQGDSYQVMINGKPYGSPSRDSNITVKEIFRGQHKVSVAVVDNKGQVLSQSKPVTVNVIRPVVQRR